MGEGGKRPGRALVLTALVLASTVITAATTWQPVQGTALEREMTRALADDAQPFAARADLAERLGAELARTTEREARGRLALLWVRAVRRAAHAIPMDGGKKPPFHEWLAHHADVMYSEPSGEWMMVPAAIWDVHGHYRGTQSADAIAWEAVENRLPGECEGYAPCELVGIDSLYGEYLRRHPQGAHVTEAFGQVQLGLDEVLRVVDGPGGHEFLTPANDCVDLVPRADALKAALLGAHAPAAALASLQALRGKCPK
jgi:hypothetical protein